MVTREGLPLGYEVFDGNRVDVTTVEEIVETMEARYGLSQRVWVMPCPKKVRLGMTLAGPVGVSKSP